MYHYLYQITNLINNMIYIGIHSSEFKNDTYHGSGIRLKRAEKKYGKVNFSKEILVYCDSREHLFKMESLIVDKEFVARKDTYNLVTGGAGNKAEHTLSTKEKIGNVHRGKTISDEQRKNAAIFFKDRIFSNDHRDKISKAKQGVPNSKEHNAKLSATLKEKYKNTPLDFSPKSCKVNDMIFSSATKAAKYLGISRYQLKIRKDFEWT